MPMTKKYICAEGVLLAEKMTGSGAVNHFLRDPLGSVIRVLQSGKSLYEAAYWPYGEVRTETGDRPSFGFVGTLGYMWDFTSLLYVRARHLRSDLGRWLTVDPLWPEEPQYGYATGNPTTWTDPEGKKAVKPPPLPVFIGGGTTPCGMQRTLPPCSDILVEGAIKHLSRQLMKCLKACPKHDDDCVVACIKKLGKIDRKWIPFIAKYLACVWSSHIHNLGSPAKNPCFDTAGVTIWRQECCDMWYMECVLRCSLDPDCLRQIGLIHCKTGLDTCYVNAS